MLVGRHRGHNIENKNKNGEWVYQDTQEPTIGNERPCGECGKRNTAEGHDGCLGIIPNVMNACCGHGIIEDSYVQNMDGECIRGIDAFEFINKELK